MAAHAAPPAGLSINPLHMAVHIVYGMMKSCTAPVGLTPLQLLGGLLGLVLLVVIVQLVLTSRGAVGWHVEDVRDDAALAAKLRAQTDGG